MRKRIFQKDEKGHLGQRIREKIRDRVGFELDEIKYKGPFKLVELKFKRRRQNQ